MTAATNHHTQTHGKYKFHNCLCNHHQKAHDIKQQTSQFAYCRHCGSTSTPNSQFHEAKHSTSILLVVASFPRTGKHPLGSNTCIFKTKKENYHPGVFFYFKNFPELLSLLVTRVLNGLTVINLYL